MVAINQSAAIKAVTTAIEALMADHKGHRDRSQRAENDKDASIQQYGLGSADVKGAITQTTERFGSSPEIVVWALDELEQAIVAVRNVLAIQSASSDRFETLRQLVASGAVLDTTAVHHRFGLSRQTLNARKKAGAIFALRVAGKRKDYYPTFLFDDDLINAGLNGVVRELRAVPPWSAWVFLTRPSHRLKGKSPVDALQSSVDPILIHQLARGYVERYAVK